MDRIDRLLSELLLDEKLALTAGADRWCSAPIPRLGIPSFKMTDGPNGARGDGASGRQTAACFPCGVALAATWNVELMRDLGQALAEEARSKGADVLLGPTINLHRTPLGGRNFECYSEDPWLTAGIASALTSGLQQAGVGACLKHFVCNDSEFERRSLSSDVDERPLRELYLRPFELTIRAADPWMIMSAYNRINGCFASSHRELLRDVLKGEWGYTGVVVSDWGAALDSVENARAGLDLEMPGPGRTFGPHLAPAVHAGAVELADVDDKVRRLLRLLERAGSFERAESAAEISQDRPAHRTLARRTAVESMVLLRNVAETLPLDPARLGRIAVIGPLAERGTPQGGGSAFVVPHYQTHPLETLQRRLGDAVELVHTPGCRIPKLCPAFESGQLTTQAGTPGLDAAFWNSDGFDGPPASRSVLYRSQAYFGRVPPEGIHDPGLAASGAAGAGARDLHAPPPHFVARYTGRFVPDESGVFTFGINATGRSRLFLDDVEQIDNWTAPTWTHDIFGAGQSTEVRASIELEAGRSYALRIEYQRPATATLATLRFGVLRPEPPDALEAAVEAARTADVALLFVGTTGEWETEGRDRESLELPDPQNRLIERVAAVAPRSVVVAQAGSPFAMPWLDAVDAVLLAWFAGQELGNAVADVLLGEAAPSGRLPTTFPQSLEQTPAFTCYPGEHGHVRYGEGIFVGYRWYDRRALEPLFPFGHGLTYTVFAYGPLVGPDCAGAHETVRLSCEITNVGTRTGQETVQLYVGDRASAVLRPERELRGFVKLRLEPGETQRAEFELGPSDLAYWDPVRKGWHADPGPYEISVGASSRDLRARHVLERRAP